ncbi:hypothetical protein MNBD_GAMMA13-1618 [hydrothermal vent metagenome]|uniref:Thioredoxin-like fold domain-containing protein n=1 Tax=hydrothermal vent metagenome TaxID=652676 RepID=A0A3B0Y5K2_9ZZZZ
MSIQVEVFTAPGCGKCGHTKTLLRAVVEAWPDNGVTWREVNVLDELDYAVQLGVLSTPAIAIDGELVFAALPSEKKLRKLLQQRIEKARC